MIEGRATARYVRGSAQKAKLVMDLIRGQGVDRALASLRFSRKHVAQDIAKVLRSAVANAQQKEGASGDVDRLYVGSCFANQGPSLKRIRAAPMGRAFRIIKRTSHLTVIVHERTEQAVAVGMPSTRLNGDDSDTVGEADEGSSKTPEKTTKATGGEESATPTDG